MTKSQISATSRLIPLGAALAAVAVFWIVAPHWLEPKFVDLTSLADGTLKDTQSSAIDMVKELNGYLVSTTTLLLGGLGWYLSQYRPPTSRVVHAAFFASVGFVILALIYAGLTDGNSPTSSRRTRSRSRQARAGSCITSRWRSGRAGYLPC